eukprot:CAMPEP_0113948322 /NCGR_PEP_ID=MMETSP1339-20121228/69755_1 /TAXON_ID=94617 /ORGANISM="Fibrocapsa japonica" /LENGTH=118 /DNA_ID=CAMNT_0000955337 /DNA_START=91 /DNA_END=447 /DNA_ORIENTATION=+ /assembly_acc=CAM_ASM_000762
MTALPSLGEHEHEREDSHAEAGPAVKTPVKGFAEGDPEGQVHSPGGFPPVTDRPVEEATDSTHLESLRQEVKQTEAKLAGDVSEVGQRLDRVEAALGAILSRLDQLQPAQAEAGSGDG